MVGMADMSVSYCYENHDEHGVQLSPYRVLTARSAMIDPRPGGMIHKFN